ncbi:MAG: transcriptional regulator, LacI family [Friedmanniella sp.]|nr:transcriptional regulator, LacI family [Friedmanniella sp.]
MPRSRGNSVVMVDVAREAGVSQKTVSRVINHAPHVRAEVRDRVLAVIDQLGYRPNVAARALVNQQRRTHVLGVIAVGLPLFGPANRVFSLEQAAREQGYELALASLPDMDPAGIRKAIDGLLARGVEGIIFEVPNHLVSVDESVFRGVPIATSVGRIPGIRQQVVIDTFQAEMGCLATEHLLELGHETVFHVAGPEEWDASRERRQGWSMALAAAGRQQPDVLQGDWSARSGYALGQRLAARPEVTAIFAANDSQAMGVIRALTEAGRGVPGDVSVVGNDDVPEAEFLMVPLTTLRSDQQAISERVLSGLVALIEDRDPDAPGPPIARELVIRSSTGPPPRRPSGL